MKNKDLAPLIVFAYNRPKHLRLTLQSLAQNHYAKDSKVYIFVDGPKTDKDKENNDLVYNVAKQFTNNHFKEVIILRKEQNQGLAKSVIDGVTSVFEKYSRVIIVEDDVVTSNNFINFMNEALDYYENNDKVWSVGGYTVPFYKENSNSVFFVQRCSSYCWGTWKNRWELVDWNVSDYSSFRFNLFKRMRFNKSGNDKSLMLDDQMNGRINSWAIRFDYAMWKSDMYNVLPVNSLAKNIGHDGTGTHSRIKDNNDRFFVGISDSESILYFDLSSFEIKHDYICKYRTYFDVSLYSRVRRYVSNLIYRYRIKRK